MTDMIDAKGLACPQPVIPTRNALESSVNHLIVHVNSEASRENVRHYSGAHGYTASVTSNADLPGRTIFLNRGIHVSCNRLETIQKLSLLEECGVEVYSCGACLKYSDMETDLKVDRIGSTFHTLQSLMQGDKIVTLG